MQARYPYGRDAVTDQPSSRRGYPRDLSSQIENSARVPSRSVSGPGFPWHGGGASAHPPVTPRSGRIRFFRPPNSLGIHCVTLKFGQRFPLPDGVTPTRTPQWGLGRFFFRPNSAVWSHRHSAATCPHFFPAENPRCALLTTPHVVANFVSAVNPRCCVSANCVFTDPVSAPSARSRSFSQQSPVCGLDHCGEGRFFVPPNILGVGAAV